MTDSKKRMKIKYVTKKADILLVYSLWYMITNKN